MLLVPRSTIPSTPGPIFSAHTMILPFSKLAFVYIRTRPEFRFRSGPVPVEFGLVPVPVWYQNGNAIFFMLYYRFNDELPASRAPSSSQTASRTLLQFPGCITCYPPVPRLHHVLSCSSLAVSRATLQFPDCITYSPAVPWLYHVLPSSSQTVSRATLEFTKCIMERKIIFLFTVCYFY